MLQPGNTSMSENACVTGVAAPYSHAVATIVFFHNWLESIKIVKNGKQALMVKT